jgi:uncharacterized glyoxalase superfamily protein PhnB
MTGKVKPIPDGFHTVTPYLFVKGASEAIEWYKKAFGAEEIGRMPMPDGELLMHAMIRIGDSFIMLTDEQPDCPSKGPKALGGTPVGLHLYVEDADAVFEQAVAAGAEVTMPITDMFWGDRYGNLTDPFGHSWSIATHIQDLTPEETAEAAKQALSEHSKP